MLPSHDAVAIDALKVHDFAFVLRSGGRDRWAYSIVAGREDDAILFVVDAGGSTKYLGRKHWASHVRMVNAERARRLSRGIISGSASPSSVSSPTEDTEGKNDNDDEIAIVDPPEEDDGVVAYTFEDFPPPPFARSAFDPSGARGTRARRDDAAGLGPRTSEPLGIRTRHRPGPGLDASLKSHGTLLSLFELKELLFDA